MDILTPKIDKAKKAVDDQNAAIKTQTGIRDAIQTRYDAESKTLSTLKDQYDQISQAISDVTDLLNNMADAAQKTADAAKAAADALTAGGQAFQDAGAGDWTVPGGDAGIGREGVAFFRKVVYYQHLAIQTLA